MHSGLIFKNSSYNNKMSGFNAQHSGALEKKASTIKENNSFFKFRGNNLQLTNTLASRITKHDSKFYLNNFNSNHQVGTINVHNECSPLRRRLSLVETVEEENTGY